MNRRKLRLVIGIVILFISLALLVWGLWPMAPEVRIVPVSPTEMQLPLPGSFLLGWSGVI
ncbi:MAG: hypothetical protein AB1894_19095 [Chloroflexota bacterium]